MKSKFETRKDFPFGELKLECIVPMDAFGYQIRAGFREGDRLFAAEPATFVEVEKGARLPVLLSIDTPEIESLTAAFDRIRFAPTQPKEDARVALLMDEIKHLREQERALTNVIMKMIDVRPNMGAISL